MSILAVVTFISIQNSLFFLRHCPVRMRTTSNMRQRTLLHTFTLIPVLILTITTDQNALLSLTTTLIAIMTVCSFLRPPRALLPTRTWCLPREDTGTYASISITPAVHIKCFGLRLFSPCLFRLLLLRCSSRHRRSHTSHALLLSFSRIFGNFQVLPPEPVTQPLCQCGDAFSSRRRRRKESS
jgi:hypothetical protein